MSVYSLAHRGRIAVQIIVAVLIVAAVVIGVPVFVSKMQLVPAIAACSVLWMMIWVAVTLIFGRIYCSTVCPAGALMDAVSRITRRRSKYYVYSKPHHRLRVVVVVAVVLSAFLGLSAVVAITDPYSAFTRMVSAIVRPVSVGVAGLVVAVLTFIGIALVAYRRGRLICNTVCPVGTVLGGLSRFSVYHPDINTDLCTNCGRCADVCKAECIDLKDHVVDSTRCVVCFDCMDVCRDEAITYRRGNHRLAMPMLQRAVGNAGVSAINKPEADVSVKTVDRRTFIAGAVAAAGSLIVKGDDGGRGSRFVDGAVPLRALNAVIPPGASSREDYLRRCTACGACVAACPSGVITSSFNDMGVRHALVPMLKFDDAYCLVDCVRCSRACPTKALVPLTPDEKQHVKIGLARVAPSNCMLYVNGTPCSVCVRRCPHGAVKIAEADAGRLLPRVDGDLCVGCGSCAASCPSQPYGAIVIEGK